jgi:hypothetical protein
MESQFMNRIPEDIIINHILPFTYRLQPRELLRDIKTFVEDFSLVEQYYTDDFNTVFLLRDLITFGTKNTEVCLNITNKLTEIMRRYFSYKKLDDTTMFSKVHRLSHFSFVFIKASIMSNKTRLLVKRYIRFLWGLMTVEERTRFINKFILVFDE